MSCEDNKISFWIKNIKLDGNNLIIDIASLGIQVMSINLRKSSLEEIFLKVAR
jgi:hypothetical protein